MPNGFRLWIVSRLRWRVFATTAAAEITVEKSPAGAVVKIDGQPFTEYITDFAV